MITRYKKLNSLKDIPTIKYVGYIWMSNDNKPIIINNSTDTQISLEENPFIVEGYLYSEEEEKSISIKNIDGEILISQVNIQDVNEKIDGVMQHMYRANNKLKSMGRYLKFFEYWHPEKDKQCLDMEVLKPNWIAFAGFTNEEDKNEL